MPAPLVIINTVGLTPRLLQYAPHMSALAKAGWCIPMREPLPAVTCTAQATMLTGVAPSQHGVVANGWLFRDTNEVRFWQQSNRLIQAEPFYATAKRRAAERNRTFVAAKLFWWFNQGADVDISVTPKPHYGIDGRKELDVDSRPRDVVDQLKRELGPFPFPHFWGPYAGIKSSEWIANAATTLIRRLPLDLLMLYLPHLDYDPQRFGPSRSGITMDAAIVDEIVASCLQAAQAAGARVWIVNEYSHCNVTTPVYLNRALRTANLVAVRKGPFGEQLDLFNSRAFAVCDHQIAHIYVGNRSDIPPVVGLMRDTPGVDHIYVADERAAIGLDHSRSGEIIVLAQPDAWFAYPFWLDDRAAPDYARTVAIHHKPGFDPCELFFDPKIHFPSVRIAHTLLMKKLGCRAKMDVIPLDAAIVRGSHGLRAQDEQDRPVWIGDGPKPGSNDMTAIRDAVLRALELEGD